MLNVVVDSEYVYTCTLSFVVIASGVFAEEGQRGPGSHPPEFWRAPRVVLSSAKT